MEKKVRCIAVDDEPLALDLVCSYIMKTPFLELVGRYNNSVQALKVLYDVQVDLLFLDIQMNDLTGIELARVIATKPDPVDIVFTTAYDQFALEGYKVNAIDYLLKPFSYEEFLRACSKAHSRMSSRQIEQSKEVEKEYLFLKVEHQLVRVRFEDILFVEGLKDYIKVHTIDGKVILTLASLKGLEEKLPSSRFMRVHRSFIVALDKIDSLTKNSVQIGNTYINVTDNYRDQFDAFYQKWRA